MILAYPRGGILFFLLALGQTVVASELAPLVPVDSKSVIPNRYIVVLKEEVLSTGALTAEAVAERESVITGFAGRHAVEPIHVYAHVLKGFAAEIPASRLNSIRADPEVEFVAPDTLIQLPKPRVEGTSIAEPLPQSAPEDPAFIDEPGVYVDGRLWGLDRIDQRNLPLDYNYSPWGTGNGVHVYVIDSGVRSTHQEFSGRIGNGISYVTDGRGTEDCNGHGTHVAGTIGGATVGVANQVILHPLRVFDCQGSGSAAGVIAAMNWVVANRPQNTPSLVNFSGGGPASLSVDLAARGVVQNGIPVIVAAGNEAEDACSTSPAREPSLITVAASNQGDYRASFSNFGSCVDLFAPGVSVYSAYNGTNNAYATLSGTSMASPHTAGVVALLLSRYSDATPTAVANILLGQATANKISNPQGSPNRLLYSQLQVPPKPLPPGVLPAILSLLLDDGPAAPAKPDFLVTGLTLNPATPAAGGTFNATVTVKNQGTLAGGANRLDVWGNQATSAACDAVGNQAKWVGLLAAGESKTFSFTGLPAGTAGSKTFRAFIDSACDTAESNDNNNQLAQNYTVGGSSGPDFVITGINLSPIVGGTFNATVTVKNQGTLAAGANRLGVWANQATAPVCNAVGNQTQWVGLLGAGEAKSVMFTGIPADAAGSKTFRAFVDSGCGTVESNEGNNQLTKAYTVP